MKDVVTTEDMNVDIMKMMGSSIVNPAGWTGLELKQVGLPQPHLPAREIRPSPVPVLAPEGRVHGGSLMAMLAGSPGLSPSDSKTLISGGPSEPRKPYMMPQSWM